MTSEVLLPSFAFLNSVFLLLIFITEIVLCSVRVKIYRTEN